MTETEEGFVFIIKYDLVFDGTTPREKFIELFKHLKDAGYCFMVFDDRELLRVTNQLSVKDIQRYFKSAPNDFNNDKWVFAVKITESYNIEFHDLNYLSSFIKCGIAIFTQYDSDGIELQVHKECDQTYRDLIEIFKKINIQEGY